MRTRLLALFDDRERHVAQPLGDIGVLVEQLTEPDCAREARGSAAHDEDADLDALVDRVARCGDEPARVELGLRSTRRDISRRACAAIRRARARSCARLPRPRGR